MNLDMNTAHEFLKKKRLIIFLLIAVILFSTTFPILNTPTQVEAKSSSEIADEINSKQKELNDLQSKLNSLNAKTKSLNSQAYGLSGSIASVENELKKIENEIEINKLKIVELETEKQLKQLDIEKRKNDLNSKLYDFYVLSHSEHDMSLAESLDLDQYWTSEKYMALIISKEKKNIDNLSTQVLGITSDIARFEKSKKEFETQGTELDAKKKDLTAQLANYNYQISVNKSQISGLANQVQSIQSDIKYLGAEQKRILEEEAQRLNGGGAITTFPVDSGDYYFAGDERDLYNGHYVGMMQWGAYDLATSGTKYQDILKKFYTGVAVSGGYSSYSISVIGYGTMNIDTYVAGLGEVPDKVCGTSQQVISNPSKYVVNNPNDDWDCWPEEAIKAQVVAARSYALYKVLNGGGSICTTAACQVYKGGTAKAWAANETAGQVVTYNGQVANALYSANACGTTMNNEDAFWAYSGGTWHTGTPVPYLRAVSYSYKSGAYCGWNWNSYGYTKQELTNIFNNKLGLGIGTFVGVTYERMSGNRVRWIRIQGTSKTVSLPGWDFKAKWNDYVWNREGGNCSGSNHHCDYIYGVKYSLYTKP